MNSEGKNNHPAESSVFGPIYFEPGLELRSRCKGETHQGRGTDMNDGVGGEISEAGAVDFNQEVSHGRLERR